MTARGRAMIFGSDWFGTRGDVVGLFGYNFAIYSFFPHRGSTNKEDIWMREGTRNYVDSLLGGRALGIMA